MTGRKPAPWPPYCGTNPDCDPTTRMVEVGDDRVPERCPCVRTANSLVALRARRDACALELAELDRRIAAADADVPPYVRGPGPVRT